MTLARSWYLVLALFAAAAFASAPAHADPRPNQQEALRQAVEAGEVRPLADITAAARRKVPGEILGVKVEHEQGRWTYELRVLDDKGRLFEVHVDGQSGDVERVKEK